MDGRRGVEDRNSSAAIAAAVSGRPASGSEAKLLPWGEVLCLKTAEPRINHLHELSTTSTRNQQLSHKLTQQRLQAIPAPRGRRTSFGSTEGTKVAPRGCQVPWRRFCEVSRPPIPDARVCRVGWGQPISKSNKQSQATHSARLVITSCRDCDTTFQETYCRHPRRRDRQGSHSPSRQRHPGYGS